MTIPDSGALTASNRVTQSHANVYNLINDRSNVPDPNDDSGDRKFVYVRKPRSMGRQFAGYPFIIVRRTRPSKGKSTVGLTKSFMDYNTQIEIYTKDSDSNSSANPNGSEQINEIVDKITTMLDNATNKRVLISYGMSNIRYDIDIDEDDYEGKAAFYTEIDLRFVNNLAVTS